MKYVKNEEESQKFGEIDEAYMTEESPSESDNEVVKRHMHPWRSNGNFVYHASISSLRLIHTTELSRLILKLDRRAEKAEKEKKTPVSARHALKWKSEFHTFYNSPTCECTKLGSIIGAFNYQCK